MEQSIQATNRSIKSAIADRLAAFLPLLLMLAPLASSNSVLPTLARVADEACEGLCGEMPAYQSRLGRFLEMDIAERMERVSGRKWTKSSRIGQARMIAAAVAEAGHEFSVDPFLLVAMMEVESRYNTQAVGGHGERGLLQIKPSTALWIVPGTDAQRGCDLHEIRCNVRSSARYISHLQHRTLRKHGFETAAESRYHVLRSYNQGPVRADRNLASVTTATTPEQRTLSYAAKIAWRTDQMRQRFLAHTLQKVVPQPTTSDLAVTTLAMNH